MKTEPDEVLFRRYLLGQLSTAEREQVEELFFTDSDRFDVFTSIENELLDDYVAGRLTAREKQLFEGNYVTCPRRSRRVKFAGAMVRYAAEHRAGEAGWREALMSFLRLRVPVPAFGFAAALGIVIVTSFWVASVYRQTEVQRVRADQLQRQLAQRSTLQDHELAALRNLAATIFVTQLTPEAATRAGGTLPVIAIPPDAQLVALRLPVEQQGGHVTYRATLRNPERGVLWDQDQLAAGSGPRPVVTLYLPATLFIAGEYSTVVTPSSDPDNRLAEFSFRIVKR